MWFLSSFLRSGVISPLPVDTHAHSWLRGPAHLPQVGSGLTSEGLIQGSQHGQSLRARQVGHQASVHKQLGCHGNRRAFGQLQQDLDCNVKTKKRKKSGL